METSASFEARSAPWSYPAVCNGKTTRAHVRRAVFSAEDGSRGHLREAATTRTEARHPTRQLEFLS